jgi:hypothetical protein
MGGTPVRASPIDPTFPDVLVRSPGGWRHAARRSPSRATPYTIPDLKLDRTQPTRILTDSERVGGKLLFTRLMV